MQYREEAIEQCLRRIDLLEIPPEADGLARQQIRRNAWCWQHDVGAAHEIESRLAAHGIDQSTINAESPSQARECFFVFKRCLMPRKADGCLCSSSAQRTTGEVVSTRLGTSCPKTFPRLRSVCWRRLDRLRRPAERSGNTQSTCRPLLPAACHFDLSNSEIVKPSAVFRRAPKQREGSFVHNSLQS